jgi:hypothetical protein
MKAQVLACASLPPDAAAFPPQEFAPFCAQMLGDLECAELSGLDWLPLFC